MLNRFQSERLLLHDFGDVILIVTINDEILHNISHSEELVVSQLKFGCRHEEADMKIVLHIFNCIHLGYQNILVKTGDTDVITLIMAHLHFFEEPYYIEVDFSFGKNRRFYDINKIAAQMTSEPLLGLMFFYAFSGSDTTSYFYNISKNVWWKVWVENSFITKTFIKLSWTPECVEEVDLHEKNLFLLLMILKIE